MSEGTAIPRPANAAALPRNWSDVSPEKSRHRHPGNTTLTAVVTNQKLAAGQLTQLARQVHASLARAIQPVHAPADGDVLYAITTNEVDEKELSPTALGIVAAELLWDAVLACFVA